LDETLITLRIDAAAILYFRQITQSNKLPPLLSDGLLLFIQYFTVYYSLND